MAPTVSSTKFYEALSLIFAILYATSFATKSQKMKSLNSMKICVCVLIILEKTRIYS